MSKAIPDFQFVDRYEEREQINSFLHSPTDHKSSNMLWLRGQKRSGVSRLLDDALSSLEAQAGFLVIKIKIGSDGGRRSLEELLGLALRHGGIRPASILRFIPLAALGVGCVLQALLPSNIAYPAAINGFLSFLFQYNNNIKVKPSIQKAPYQILADLLRQIHARTNSRVVLAIDVYNLADSITSECYEGLFAELLDSDDFRFILASSKDDESSSLLPRLVENFSLKPVAIIPFSDPEHFRSILSGCFPDSEGADSTVMEIFSACSKSPGKLRQCFLEYAGEAYGSLSYEGFVDYIRSMGIPEDLNFYEEYLLSAMKVLDAPIPSEQLPKLGAATLLSQAKLPDEMQTIVLGQMLEATHSLIKRGYARENERKQLALDAVEAPEMSPGHVAAIAMTISDLVKQDESDFILEYIDEDLAPWSKASVLYYAGEKTSYGKSYAGLFASSIQSGHKTKALTAIDRMLEHPQYISEPLGLLTEMASFSYANGRYSQALKLLSLGDPVNEANNTSRLNYEQLMLKGKSANALGLISEAELLLREAENAATTNDDLLLARAMRQLVVTEVAGREAEAEQLFFELFDSFAGNERWSSAECFISRIKVDYWRPGDDTTAVLNKALRESQQKGYWKNIPYLEVALGLQALRENSPSEAFGCFEKANELLSRIKPHEQAYTYNDMGVCRLLEGSYDQALTLFRKGNAWASTPYIKAVLLANRAISLVLAGRTEDAKSFCLEMDRLFKSSDSSLVQSRLCLAICFICLVAGDARSHLATRHAALYEEKRDWLLSNLDLESRQYKRILEIDKEAMRAQAGGIREIAGKEFSYHEAPFQPWIATLHHD